MTYSMDHNYNHMYTQRQHSGRPNFLHGELVQRIMSCDVRFSRSAHWTFLLAQGSSAGHDCFPSFTSAHCQDHFKKKPFLKVSKNSISSRTIQVQRQSQFMSRVYGRPTGVCSALTHYVFHTAERKIWRMHLRLIKKPTPNITRHALTIENIESRTCEPPNARRIALQLIVIAP